MKLVQFNILVRQWMRGGVSTAVSLVSLSLGLICSTILLLFAVEEFRAADALTPDPTDKYQLLTEEFMQQGRYSNAIYSNTTPLVVAAAHPQIVDYAVVRQCIATWNDEKYVSGDKNHTPTIAATPSFTKYYKIPMIEGNLDSVLAAPDRIAVTRQYAAQLFPDKNPIGQNITGEFKYYDPNSATESTVEVKRNFTITAIIDNSKLAAINFRAIYRYPEAELFDMNSICGTNYAMVTLAPGTDIAKLCAKHFSDSLCEAYQNDPGKIRLDPINEAYLVDEANTTEGDNVFKTRSQSSLYICLTLALVILFVASFNYINITLSRSASRLKNLAGQRIMGASKWNVRGQIVADTAINVALAILLSLFFLPLSMEGFNSFMGSSISMSDLLDPINALCALGVLAIMVVVPSVSLIVKFSIRNPLETFKNPEGRRVRAAQSLVVAQIMVSVALLTFGANVARQMTHVANSLPHAKTVLRIETADDNLLPKEFVDRVEHSASTRKMAITDLRCMKWPLPIGGREIVFHWVHTPPEIFDVFGVRPTEGRLFEAQAATANDNNAIQNIVASHAAVKALGIKGSPIGQKIEGTSYRIVGVVSNLRLVDAKTEAQPVAYDYKSGREHPTCLFVSFTGSVDDKIAEIVQIFKETNDAGAIIPQIMTVGESFLNKNPEIGRMQTMIDVFTTISFLLTAFGLFGLSWYMVERRRREIAIRKTYGATVIGMVAMLCRSFLWQSLIAIVIALPAAYFISGYWLEGFVFRVDNAWWVMAISAGLTLVVVFVTVIGQTIRAALTNPVKYIKTE